MAGLVYRRDMDDVRARLTTWWNGGDIGRPVMQIGIPRKEPHPGVPEIPVPDGVTAPWYTTRSLDYRVNLGVRAHLGLDYAGEAVPNSAPDLAPNCLALYLGCKGHEGEHTVWCEPFLHQPGVDDFAPREDNFYWQFTLKLLHEFRRLGGGKFLFHFPDLIEGLDTLAAMRDTQTLLVDLIERPAWVHFQLGRITELYFHYYDRLYELSKDETGGSVFWAWAPGRMAKLQCDFSAMIGPEMFGDFMVPALNAMLNRLDYAMYHWDGPGAIPHHDHLLGLPRLNVIQWTAGSGAEPGWHRRWWPLFHKTFDRGKGVFIGVSGSEQETVERLMALKREFGPHFKRFMFNLSMPSPESAERLLAQMSD